MLAVQHAEPHEAPLFLSNHKTILELLLIDGIMSSLNKIVRCGFGGDFVTEAVETKPGIFEFSMPQEVEAGQWMADHLDCDTIIDDHGKKLLVYAFVVKPEFNFELEKLQEKKYKSQYILKGISSDGLNSII